jgi:hypothetical protein
MGKIKRYRNGIERFLSGEKGQRFFNFAYSIGAAIVIWGALFEILHMPGGKILLSIGMGTEVLMFILSAFDDPNRGQQPMQMIEPMQREQIIVMEQQKSQQPVQDTSNVEAAAKGAAEINAMYEKMLSTSGKYCDEAEKMTRNMEQLNEVYANMLNAMTGKRNEGK